MVTLSKEIYEGGQNGTNTSKLGKNNFTRQAKSESQRNKREAKKL
jgi:hypothetical protein